jgi:predicted DNA-binding protein YlxM (UPF0122 family)
MQKMLALTNKNVKSEFIYVIYDINGVYVRECKTLVEVAKFFRTSKQSISNHLRRTRQPKNNFKYKNYTIEHFDINGIY